MEILVVLVLVGLISTLLVNGLMHVLNLRIRFLSLLENQTTERLQSHWFRDASAALTPDHPSGEHVFSGDTHRFQGLTFAPLKGMRGVPTPISMELSFKDGKILLQYKERNDEPWEIALWTGSDGNFSYLHPDGHWHRHWPPGYEKSTQLPEGILLEVRDVRSPVIWFAGRTGRPDPKPRLRDLLGNL